jgi:hypothetical protein
MVDTRNGKIIDIQDAFKYPGRDKKYLGIDISQFHSCPRCHGTGRVLNPEYDHSQDKITEDEGAI